MINGATQLSFTTIHSQGSLTSPLSAESHSDACSCCQKVKGSTGPHAVPLSAGDGERHGCRTGE